MATAQSITAMSAINDFHSCILRMYILAMKPSCFSGQAKNTLKVYLFIWLMAYQQNRIIDIFVIVIVLRKQIQHVLSLTCNNLDIVLVGGSNKAIEVFDMNTASSVRTISDAHSRAVHCICQNKVCRNLRFEY